MISLPHLHNHLLLHNLARLRYAYQSHFSKIQYFHTVHSHSSSNLVEFYNVLLQQCITNDKHFNLEQPVKQIHAHIILTSSSFSAFLSARLVSAYSKLHCSDDAQKVFDKSPEDCLLNSLLWNSILRANVSFSRYRTVLHLYRRMRELNVHPDGFGFPLIIRACAKMGDARLCRLVHCHVVGLGFLNNVHVGNEVLGMYGEIGLMEAASRVFDGMNFRSLISWNVMMAGFAKNLDCEGAFGMLCRMENEGWEPNSVTWTSLISSFARCGRSEKAWEMYISMRERGVAANAESIAVVMSVCTSSEQNMKYKGEVLHSHAIKAGFEQYVFVNNTLISMYGRNCAIEKSEYLFSRMKPKSLLSWNAMISAYAQSGLCDEAYSMFLRMNQLEEGLMIRPNVVSWTALINGFASVRRHYETLDLFRKMLFAPVLANDVTVASVLSVCADLSALSLGREVHAHAIRSLRDSSVLVTNGLINMYMKCGSLMIGHSVFERMVDKDILSWNSMITGYGMHGFGDSALRIFHQLVDVGVKPDEVTFVAVLSACGHAGLVAQGRELFSQMTKEFQVKPRLEHYACMVDLLGRAGLLQEASSIVKSMPMEPNTIVWSALLNSCRMHKNTDIADETAHQIFSLSSEAAGSYILLSNLYAENGKWNDCASVRLSARTKGLKKIAGQSWIEVNKKVCTFSAGRPLNVEMEEIQATLDNLNLHMGGEDMKILTHVPERIFNLKHQDGEISLLA